ncbi:MAG: HAD family hydrolase [Propioniciclava sp.]
MQRKAVFIDVDGTLVDERGQLPASAVTAIRRARERGHRVFLATGRSVGELWPEILAIGFDGMVCASGSYVEVAGEPLLERYLSQDQIRRIRDYFDAGVGTFFLQGHAANYASAEAKARLWARVEHDAVPRDGAFTFIDTIVTDADPARVEVSKVIYFEARVAIDAIRAAFPDLEVVPASVSVLGESAGELALAGITKAAGIDAVLGHLGVDLSDTFALGDSYNDLEMLEHVAVGIAMANAPEAVKTVADDVTGTPETDGVAEALARYGLTG